MSTMANAAATKSVSRGASIFVGFTTTCASALLAYGLLRTHGWHAWEFLSLLLVAALTARLKIKLPGMNGNMSVSLPFILIAVTRLSLLEALSVAAFSVLVQSMPKHSKKFKPVQALFNVSTAVISAGLGWQALHRSAALHLNPAVSLLLGCAFYFFASTIPVAAIISLTEDLDAFRVWSDIVNLSFPYYLASTGLASIAAAIGGHTSWPMLIGMSLVMFVTYRSYRLYFALVVTGAPSPGANARAAAAAH
jgi:hypothetical protein